MPSWSEKLSQRINAPENVIWLKSVGVRKRPRSTLLVYLLLASMLWG